MFKPQTANSSGSSRRNVNRFAGTWMPARAKHRNGWKKKDPVGNRLRTWRMKRMSQKALLWLLLPVFIVGLAGLGYTMLLRSDIFRITAVSVQGNQVTNQQQILKAAGVNLGGNLLTLDVPRVEALIKQEQWVDDVWIKRHWPSTVEVNIREYKPFALINLERDGTRELYYMNNKGVVFAPSTAAKDLDYPVVNGSFLADDLHGKRFKVDSLGALALDFLKLTARGNQILPTQAVSEISVDPEIGLIVYLVDHPFPIYMGKEKIKIRFSRLVKVLAKLYRDDKIKGVAEIRMDYAENKILVARIDEAS